MKNQPKYKLKIIVTLSFLLAILLLCSTILFSFTLKRFVTNQIVENAQNTSAQLQSSVEQILEVMNNSLVQISLDSEVQSFSDRYELLDIFDYEDVYESLSRFRAINKYIDKLYVCYYQDGLAIDLNGIDARMTSIDQLSDKDMINAAVERCLSEQFKKILTVYNMSPQNKDTILVAAKSAPPMASVPRAVIVVTVKHSYFQELLQAISLEKECNVLVLDENGEFLFGKDSTQPIFNSENKQVNIEDKNFIFVSTVSQETGWEYVYQIPKQKITAQVRSIMMWLWIITIAMLGTALVGVRFLAAELYKPVKKVINTISTYGASGIDDNDDLKYINDKIYALIVEKKYAEKLIEENKPFLRNDALQKLINTEDPDESALIEHFHDYGVSFIEKAWYCTAVLSIHQLDVLSRYYDDKEVNAILLLEIEKIREIVLQNDNVTVEFIREQQDRKTVMLFSLNMKNERDCSRVLREIINAIFLMITEDIGEAVTIGVGNIHAPLSAVWKSYQEAKSAYQYRVIEGGNTIFFASDLPKIQKRGFIYPFQLENKLFNTLKYDDRAALDDALYDFFEYTRQNVRTVLFVGYLSVQIFNDILNFLHDLSIDSSFVCDDQNSELEDIVGLDTIDTVEAYFRDMLYEINDYIVNRKRDANKNLSNKIIAFIDEHYRDEDISLDMLSSKLYFSTSYIAREFKNATGKSIKEYITEKRIAEAKDMLSTRNVKISKVAMQVGYSNVRSFINIFKKHTGHTPGEYKDEELKG